MNVVYEIIKPIIPVRMEATLGVVAGVFGTLTSYFWGAWSNALEVLLVMMVLDYVSGLLAAFVNPDLAANSKRGFKGIAKKLFILLLITMAHCLDTALGVNEICTMAVFFYIANEGLSITENAAKVGVPIPTFIEDSLEQLSHEKKAREKPEGK